MKIKEYLKWLFTRWYFYLIIFISLVGVDPVSNVGQVVYLFKHDLFLLFIRFSSAMLTGFILVSIIIGIKKLVSSPSTSRNNS